MSKVQHEYIVDFLLVTIIDLVYHYLIIPRGLQLIRWVDKESTWLMVSVGCTHSQKHSNSTRVSLLLKSRKGSTMGLRAIVMKETGFRT